MEASNHNTDHLLHHLLYTSTRLGSHVPSSNIGIPSWHESRAAEDTCSHSDFTEWFDQHPHLCIAGFHSLLSVPQLWREAGSDGHTHQDICAAVIVPNTSMYLTTDESGQYLLLLDKRQKSNQVRFQCHFMFCQHLATFCQSSFMAKNVFCGS